MNYYVYETTPTFIAVPFVPLIGTNNIIEHTLAYDFITCTNDMEKCFKRIGVYPYPRQLKWENGIMIMRVTEASSPYSIGKLIIICCSESAAENFERQVLKNNLRKKKRNENPFNMVELNKYHNSKQKEKRLLSSKYSK